MTPEQERRIEAVCSAFPQPIAELMAIALVTQYAVDDWCDKIKSTLRSHGHQASCETCKSSGCCHQYVMTTPLDALPIAAKLHRRGMNTPRQRNEFLKLGEMQSSMDRQTYFREGFKCPFNTLGMCDMYKVRPFNCRSYFVGSDPVFCLPPKLRPGFDSTSNDESQQCLDIRMIDNGEIVVAYLETMKCVCEGADIPFKPYIGALPSMVARMMEAIKEPHRTYDIIAEHCAIDMEALKRMALEQGPLKQVGSFLLKGSEP